MPSQFRSDEAAAWLQFAADDLGTARALLGVTPSRVRQSLFHAQQAAEKSLKAFLIWHEQPFPLTHDLAVLLRLCVSIDSGIATGVEPALDLTQFAARFRYPGEDELPSAMGRCRRRSSGLRKHTHCRRPYGRVISPSGCFNSTESPQPASRSIRRRCLRSERRFPRPAAW